MSVDRVLGGRSTLAAGALAIAVLVLAGIAVERAVERQRVERLIDQVEAITRALARHRSETGLWLPGTWQRHVDGSASAWRIHPDPFAPEPRPVPLPGLDATVFDDAAHRDIVLQLVRFGPETDLGHGPALLDPPLTVGAPYLRLLLAYGPAWREQLHLVDGLVAHLGADRVTRVGDHLFVVDVRSVP